MKMKSVMRDQFQTVVAPSVPRSSFDRSRGYKTTFDAGLLIPFFLDEALPGDTYNVKMTGFARLATPIHPYMDNAFMDTHFFAVPKRLVWTNWPKFCGEQTDPGDSTDYTIPQTTSYTWANDTQADYLRLPIDGGALTVNTLPFRAINLIWNEWFRDENLQDSLAVPKTDGPDQPSTQGYVPLKRRGKRHDYFTSCLPWPQKGTSVDIPLGTSAPVVPVTPRVAPRFEDSAQTAVAALDVVGTSTDVQTFTGPAGGTDLFWERTALEADLSTATAATINELRQAAQVQKIYERDARGGTRLIEVIKAHFGVVSPDARLQRPEFLGGGSSPVNVTPVPQTGQTATTPQGNLAGFGEALLSGHGFVKSFVEHCYIIGFVSVRADLTYQQGMQRLWSRSTRWDFYWPDLAHIGEQAVLNKEIYYDAAGTPDDVFGYQERFAEYRYGESGITGQFRSSAPSSLDAWHLSQEFASQPVLDSDFIEEDPPFDRVIAVPAEPHFLFDSYIKCFCARPMPLRGTPGINRF